MGFVRAREKFAPMTCLAAAAAAAEISKSARTIEQDP